MECEGTGMLDSKSVTEAEAKACPHSFSLWIYLFIYLFIYFAHFRWIVYVRKPPLTEECIRLQKHCLLPHIHVRYLQNKFVSLY